ncbi:MAG: hypothetical protein WCQ99_16015 [Pseudomonadota bacterium]
MRKSRHYQIAGRATPGESGNVSLAFFAGHAALKTTGMVAALVFFLFSAACGKTVPPRNEGSGQAGTLHIGTLISHAYWVGRSESSKKKSLPALPQKYIEALIADGKVTIGLGIGTEDLGKIYVPEREEDRTSRSEHIIQGKKVLVEGRLILSREEFKKALEECEIIFITSHSRFGAGPVFLHDGKAEPYRMQKKQGYEIIMPESEVSGYQGKIKRSYVDPVKGKKYTVFEPDSSDLDKAMPLHGYQLLVLSTCTSRKHFLEDISGFRGYYPTTAIFTTRPSCMDTGMEVFVRFLGEIFQGSSIEAVVTGMNEEYLNVSRRKVKMKIPPWQVIENLYAVGINNVP